MVWLLMLDKDDDVEWLWVFAFVIWFAVLIGFCIDPVVWAIRHYLF